MKTCPECKTDNTGGSDVHDNCSCLLKDVGIGKAENIPQGLIKGKVKWFSEEKGYGYIVSDDGKDHYFNIRDIQGTNLPKNGDIVYFESSQSKKGLRASSIKIISSSTMYTSHNDDRATCSDCGKKMIPRIILGPPLFGDTPEPKRSVCPYCGSTYKEFKKDWCFIATAVYGDPISVKVIALRRFRDETLQQWVIGRIFITIYYKVSPPIAGVLTRFPKLAACLKPLLNFIAKLYE